MEDSNRKYIRIKEKELATLDERMSDRRSTLERELVALERELATLDARAQQERQKLEQDLRILHKAVHITEPTLTTSNAPPKGYTKQEREDLFEFRSQVMWRLLDDAQGREVHSKNLAVALNRPESTIKDYYNEQLELRPADCFWETGIDKAHFRRKDGYGFNPVNAPPSRVPQAVQPALPERWHASIS